jgi:hypothetical protein
MQDDVSSDGCDVLRSVVAGVYERLTRSGEQRPWAVAELVLELHDPIAVQDALVELHDVGLVHRSGGFVWASRAAMAASALAVVV